MDSIFKIGYFLLTPILGFTFYYFSAVLKKMSSMSVGEFNEDEIDPDDIVDEKEAKLFNRISLLLFIFVGAFIWLFLGILIGRLAYTMAPENITNWPVYIFVYFLFLRTPFGFINKMMVRSFELKLIPEKIVFSFCMIIGYIISIKYYSSLPSFLTWHVLYLN